MSEPWIDNVIRFWFEETDASQWFTRDDRFDAVCRERFEALHQHIAALPIGALDTPLASVAGVIVLDQFPRNMYRASPRAYATDARALAHAQHAIARGFDQQLTPKQRMFLYMPLQHAEDRHVQAQSVELFDRLGLEDTARYAREHQQIVERFSRFPHRNAVLGRASTPEELEFVRTHPGF
jgi:uncharacterized protein (DUF924 family)